MYRFLLATIIALALASPPAPAADQPQADAAEKKAELLEQGIAAEEQQKEPAPVEPITRAEVQAVDPNGEAPLDDAITCLARTIYWEAKGEGVAGMEAIASVVMNRLGHEGYPGTVCEIVRQGSESGSCQFSWWCDGRPDDVEEAGPFETAKEISRKALNRQLDDRTGGALYFHQKQVKPFWSTTYRKTAEIGDHLFYKPADGSAK